MFDARKVAGDFSKAAAHYAEHAELQWRIGKELMEGLMLTARNDALLLDVGSGSGEVTSLWPGPKIALDAAFGMCAEAAKKHLACVQAKAEQLPLPSASVEVVASNLMLQWLPSPELFFAEAARVLKPGGVLAATCFVEGTLCELKRAFNDAGEQHRLSEFAPAALLTQKAEAAGFQVESDRVETILLPYDDVMKLARHLQDIGATNKRENRPRGMLTPRKIRALAVHYPRSAAGITASWVVQTLIARKA